MTESVPAARRARVDLDELAALEEQRVFLLRSLEDLEAEHAAGDLDDSDFEALHADYTVRAARVIEAIENSQQLVDATEPSHRGIRRLMLFFGVAVVAVVAGLVVTNVAGSHRETAKGVGTVPVSKATQACIEKMGATFGSSTAASDFATQAVETLKCFTARIEADPTDAAAYTYRARTESLIAGQLDGVAAAADVANFSRRAAADLAKALKLQPDYADALAFAALDAAKRGDQAAAKRYLQRIDRLQLPANNPVLPIVENAIRPAVEGATTTSSAPASSAPQPSTPVTR